MTTIVQAMAAVMADVQAVGKNDRNQAQGFKFRGIDAVMNAVGPALRAHGVVVVPCVVSSEFATVEIGKNRTPMGHARVTVQYVFHGPEGDSISSSVAAEAMDSGDKATAKAMSVAFRTCLLQALCLPTDEPDPDADSYERSSGHDVAGRDDSSVPEVPGPDDSLAPAWRAAMEVADGMDVLNAIAEEIRLSRISESCRRSLLPAYQAAHDRLSQ